ncbi:class I SAM-dependent methyltransferase [Arhodomonas aquaeolei]|uniref:class I SAM-dependent methyltransferase n=1 Tax=Arhodomonas aquaeolei TaxID=2369 RepID=UPI000376B537|nr:class I SAM-dependent methyltransferase [Arhodomonas aquaeolei]
MTVSATPLQGIVTTVDAAPAPPGWPVLEAPPQSGLYLHWDGWALALCRATPPRMRLVLDPAATSLGRRGRQASVGNEHIARACGLRGGGTPRIVDATAGAGRDAGLLAGLGAQVTMVERSPVVAALLADALRRAGSAPATAPVAARLALVSGEASAYLGDHVADIVYLDPMYHTGRRKALAGKEMQLLQALLGPDADADTLLDAARGAASQRVVVKRHRHAPPLAGRRPHHSLTGRSTRFDVYLPAG